MSAGAHPRFREVPPLHFPLAIVQVHRFRGTRDPCTTSRLPGRHFHRRDKIRYPDFRPPEMSRCTQMMRVAPQFDLQARYKYLHDA